MAFQFYVAIKGKKQGQFKGDTGHKDKIVGLGLSYEVTSPRDAASGQASGKRQHKPLTIVKEWGASSPQIYQALVSNEDLESVDLEFVRTTVKNRRSSTPSSSRTPQSLTSGSTSIQRPRNLNRWRVSASRFAESRKKARTGRPR